MSQTHGGQIYQHARHCGLKESEALNTILDFSASIPPWRFDYSKTYDAAFNDDIISHYPDSQTQELTQQVSDQFAIAPKNIQFCNGVSSAILNLFCHLRPLNTVLYTPVFGEYLQMANHYSQNVIPIERPLQPSIQSNSVSSQIENQQTTLQIIEALAKQPVPQNSLIVWVNPATPDGKHYRLQEMQPLISLWQQQNCWVLVDESFLPFISLKPNESFRSLLSEWPRLIVLQSLTKYFACPGLRIGCVFAHPEFIQSWPQASWPISVLDQKVLLSLMQEPSLIRQNQQLMQVAKTDFIQTLEQSSLVTQLYHSDCNFVLLKTRVTAKTLAEKLAQKHILVRDCESFGLGNHHLRLAIKSPHSNQIFLTHWQQIEKELNHDPV